MRTYSNSPRFRLGKVEITAGVMLLNIDILGYIRRHQSGDYGDVTAIEAEENDICVDAECAVLSRYNLAPFLALEVFTNWERTATQVRMAGE